MDKILILGVGGMLGHRLFLDFKQWAQDKDSIKGTCRQIPGVFKDYEDSLYQGVHVPQLEALQSILEHWKPQWVINCIGLIKQLPSSHDPALAIAINALFPHQLAKLCAQQGARMVHVSTDCVFDGLKGPYTEETITNAVDLYGRTKALGEVTEEAHVLTLRTSLIGHELSGHLSLVDWFLKAPSPVNAYTKALYTGFPTTEFSRILWDYVLPQKKLCGLYQVASQPITKFELLNDINKTYNLKKHLNPSEQVSVDRRLVGDRFNRDFHYQPPPWQDLVKNMHLRGR